MIEFRNYGIAGPAAVLLHGGPGSPGGMASLAQLLSNRFRIVEPLQRWSGNLPLTVDQHVADLEEVIGQLAEPVHLVGSSWGAMLALTYAARCPVLIRQVILIGCGTFDEDSRAVYQSRMSRATTSEDQARMNQLEEELAAASDPGERNALFGQLGEVASRIQSHALLESEVDRLEADERGHHETWADAIRLQEQGIQPGEFASIQCPVLMLHGADDPHPGDMIRNSLMPVIDVLQYREFERCGHLPWLEQHARDEFLDALRDALDEK